MADINYNQIMDLLMQALDEAKKTEVEGEIPVGVSNRHIHLSQRDLDILFGPGYALTPMKDLSQPGQFACKETLTIAGKKGAIEKVRILGPVRNKTQVEVLASDSIKKIGAYPAVRMSGKLDGTPGCTLIGPKGTVELHEGVIVAQRHIHMLPEDAQRFGVTDGQIVGIKFGGERGGIMENVAIRVTTTSKLELHVDQEEANAFGLISTSKVTIVK